MSARDRPAMLTRIRIANNLCPICWMPLGMEYENGGDIQDRWSVAQIIFKGKPAYSVMNPDNSSQTSRPVLGFGISDIIPHAADAPNYQKCHYVHYVQFGNRANVKNLWFGERLEYFAYMAPTAVHVSVAANNFHSLVCEERGVFSKVVSGPLKDYLGGLATNQLNCNWKVVNVLAVKLFYFFAGCQDCNQKMSLRNALPEIFDLAFPDITPLEEVVQRGGIRGGGRPAPPPKRLPVGKFFDAEEMAHFLMLSGMLDRETEVNGISFQVKDKWRQTTWSLRYIMMWCALQILFSMRMIEGTDRQIRHHRVYIYYGVMDFYASLWFYAMHCLYLLKGGAAFSAESVKNETGTFASAITMHAGAGSVVLEFEEFHFYYTSVLPIFLRKQAAAPLAPRTLEDSQLNLSTTLFGENWSVQTRDDVVNRLNEIYTGMFAMWDAHVVNISMGIHQNFQAAGIYRDFFAKPSDIVRMREARKNLPVEVNSFAGNMGSGWYWFHFRYITFNRIALESKMYQKYLRDAIIGNRNPPSAVAAVRIWRGWYEELSRAVGALG